MGLGELRFAFADGINPSDAPKYGNRQLEITVGWCRWRWNAWPRHGDECAWLELPADSAPSLSFTQLAVDRPNAAAIAPSAGA